LFFEFFFGPGVVSHAVVGDRAGIDDDALEVTGLKFHVAEVERGGLQGVRGGVQRFSGSKLPGEMRRTTCMSAT